MNNPPEHLQTNILSIDIGGSSIKAVLLNDGGEMISDYVKAKTPPEAEPNQVLDIIKDLVKTVEQSYDRISIGFPGYVKFGVVKTAPNLGENKWNDIPFGQMVADALGKQVRLVNDADQQGLGVVAGKGFELVFTVGTGFGTALLFDGELLPHLELAHFPRNKRKDYDAYIGDKAFDKKGKDRWNRRLKKIIKIYKTVFNYDALYIGGGNAKEITFELDDNITLVSNREGIKGGAKLWKQSDKFQIKTLYPT